MLNHGQLISHCQLMAATILPPFPFVLRIMYKCPYYHLNGVSGAGWTNNDRVGMFSSLVSPAMPTISKAVTGRNCVWIPGMIQLSASHRTLGNFPHNSPVSTIICTFIPSDLVFYFFALASSGYYSFMWLHSFIAQTFVPRMQQRGHYHPCTPSAYTALSASIMQWTLQ